MNHKLESRLPGEISITSDVMGFPGGSDGKKERIHLWCGRPEFHPWVEKVPWRREWLSTLEFWPGEFHGQRRQAGYRPWGHTWVSNFHLHLQICRWQHPNGRKWRGTKEPLDKGERAEWKSWLKTQHSKNEDHGLWSNHLMANRWGKK